MENNHQLIVQYRSKEILMRRSSDSTRQFNSKMNLPLQIIPVSDQQNNPWDEAHNKIRTDTEIVYAEPDMNCVTKEYMEWMEKRLKKQLLRENEEKTYYEYMEEWPHPDKRFGWYLGDEFSQLKAARDHLKSLEPKNKIRIAHLDTGYRKEHITYPKDIINEALQRNFVDGEEDRWNIAEDNLSDGLLQQPGHGTGTLSILAGGMVNIEEYEYHDYIGLHDLIEIVPIRIAKSVVLFKTAAFVKALDYIINVLNSKEETRVHIISMSMGGVACKSWAEMVNLAYENGIFIATAGGNNFGKVTPTNLVYPARFNRTVGVTGVTYNYSPYTKPYEEASPFIMEGNYGPTRLMNNVVAAFTPNVFWATYKFNNIVSLRGDGTSSATPQVASAAALYYMKNYETLEKLPQKWMRVEAIKKALFCSCKKEISDKYDKRELKKYFGNGVLQARVMLDIPVAEPDELEKARKDVVFFPLFKLITGLRKRGQQDQFEEDMYETELLQLVAKDKRLQEIMDMEELDIVDMDPTRRAQFIDYLLKSSDASIALKEQLNNL